MDTTKQSPVILSLCTGLLRGLEVGIERALERPVTIAAYAEIEAFVVANLIAGMEASVLAPAPVWTDLKSFPWEKFRGKIHGIIGGYPCQPFSVAGNQKGTDDPRHLWPFIKEGIQKIRPQFCFFENVRGHLNLGFEQVKADLEELDYKVEPGIYSAQEVGATHRRERLFIIAILADSRLLRSQINEEQATRVKQYSEGLAYSKVLRKFAGSKEYRTYRKFDKFVEGAKQRSYTFDRSIIEEELGAASSELGDRKESYRTIAKHGEGDFPSRPGQPQYNWEHPRVVKPGLGCTINGYNYREDLLRGIGNGVVEQTAAKAFLDLLSKF